MSFRARTDLASRLEQTFIDAFNENILSHKMLKSGIEATDVGAAHQYIRFCRDATSQFVRYLPDAVMLSLDGSKEDTALIEFKCADTGVHYDSFFQRIRRECQEMTPPSGSRHDVYNIEADALEHYRRLAELDVKIVVVAYRSWHNETPLRAQFAQDIEVCNEYDPNQSNRNTGSGTLIANANFASLVRATDFFVNHYGLDRAMFTNIERAVEAEFKSM